MIPVTATLSAHAIKIIMSSNPIFPPDLCTRESRRMITMAVVIIMMTNAYGSIQFLCPGRHAGSFGEGNFKRPLSTGGLFMSKFGEVLMVVVAVT